MGGRGPRFSGVHSVWSLIVLLSHSAVGSGGSGAIPSLCREDMARAIASVAGFKGERQVQELLAEIDDDGDFDPLEHERSVISRPFHVHTNAQSFLM